MTRNELIDSIALQYPELGPEVIAEIIKEVFNYLTISMANGERIEVRGFGCFSVRERAPRMSRNPKTGEKVYTPSKKAIHFKPGKELKQSVDKQAIVERV